MNKKIYVSVIYLIFVGIHVFSMISIYPNYELYRSPLVGGLEGGTAIFKYEGGGIAYKKAADFIRMSSLTNSSIYIGGQVPILNYYLPEYTLLWGSGYELTPGLEFLLYLLNNNVRYVVFGLEWTQYNNNHPAYLTLKGFIPDFVFQSNGAELIWIYEVSPEMLAQLPNYIQNPGFETDLDYWEIFLGAPSVDQNESLSGIKSLRIFDIHEENHRIQQFFKPSNNDSRFILTGWAKGENVHGRGHPFIRIEVKFYNNSIVGTEARWRDLESNFDWKFRSISITINNPQDVETVNIIIGTWDIYGTLWMDDVFLFSQN